MTSLGCSTSTKTNISLLNMKSNNNKKLILKPHTTMTNSYNVVLPASIGDADQVLKIASVGDNTAICEWGTGGGGGGGGSGIVNNRIDGDLTIGEDDSEMLTIASKLHIPGGESGQVLTKGTDGSIEYGPTAFDSVTLPNGGVVKEYICEEPSGQTITTAYGDSVTLNNVNAVVEVSGTTYVDVAGSVITYRPPAGTTKVIYEYDLHCGFGIDGANVFQNRVGFEFYQGGVKQDDNRSEWVDYGVQGTVTAPTTLRYVMDATGWTTAQQLKLMVREGHASTDRTYLYNTPWVHNLSDGNYLSKPLLTVKAIGAPSSFTTANPLLANPSTADKGKIITVNSTGDNLEYGGVLQEKNFEYKMLTGRHQIQLPARGSGALTVGSNGAEIFNDGNEDLEITITPSTASSKILLSVNLFGEAQHPKGVFMTLQKTVAGSSTLITPSSTDSTLGLISMRHVSSGNSEYNSTAEAGCFRYVDVLSSQQSVTYTVVLCNENSGINSFWTNGAVQTSPGLDNGISVITAEEVGGNAITSFTQEQALAGAGGTAAFTANASSVHHPSFTAFRLHDDTYINFYASNSSSAGAGYSVFSNGTGAAFVDYEFVLPQVVTKYILWPRYNTGEDQNARIWELRAADSKQEYLNGNFTTLDSQSLPGATTAAGAEDGWSTIANGAVPNTTKPSDSLYFGNHYHLSNISAYKYYVLHITGNYGSPHLSIQEWALYGGGFTIPSQIGNAGKQLITNGTSLSWGSPSSILVPSPTGNANKVLQANSAGNALEYGDSEIFKRWVSIMGSLDVTAGRNYKFPWDNSTIKSSNNNFIVFNESYDDFVISKTGFYRWFLKTKSSGNNSHGSRNYNWTLRLPGSSRTTSNPTSSVHTAIYSGVDEWRSGGAFTYTPSPSGNQDSTFSYFVGTFEIDSSLTNQNIALQNGYSNRWYNTTYFTDSEFFIEKIS